MNCQIYFEKAKGLINAASLTFFGVLVAILLAMAMNAGFFSAVGAPFAMVGAAVIAGTAGALLKQALDNLKSFIACGGLSPECKGPESNFENMLVGAITSMAALVTACIGVAVFAWIPWIGEVPMAVVYVSAAVVSATLVALQLMWKPVDECQIKVTHAVGPLEPGEQISDPWFLRLKPLKDPSYSEFIENNAIITKNNALNDRWLRCNLLSVTDWQIGARAYITGKPEGPLNFSWKLENKELGTGLIEEDGKQSVLSITTPSSGENVVLHVEARDKKGLVKFKEVTLDLSAEQLGCFLTLPLLPINIKSPIYPWTPERLKPAIDAFMKNLGQIEKPGITQIAQQVSMNGIHEQIH